MSDTRLGPVKLIVEDYDQTYDPDTAEPRPPIYGASRETMDYWDHRTAEWPDHDGWLAEGLDHREAHPDAPGVVCRRFEGRTPDGSPHRVWTLEVDDLVQALRNNPSYRLAIAWDVDPDGRVLALELDCG